MFKKTVRVRFAPSPTGELHIGGARTALFNYLFAKHNKGKFIIRLEDTDQARYVPGAEKRMLEDLAWLGLSWDEGPDSGGTHQPYVQSQRLPYYQRLAEKLLDKKLAYRCFCAPETLEKMRATQIAAKQAPKYDRRCLKLTTTEIENNLKNKIPFVVRMVIPPGETSFDDVIHKTIKVANNSLDDQILLKSDGFPTYHLANVADDHAMQITHVIRAEEWLASTPKHVILYKALGWPLPVFAHVPLILNSDRSKMSKRHDGDLVWLSTYRQAGYLPEALINFLALLGWSESGDREDYSLAELVKSFQLERVHTGGAIFDLKKLQAFNNRYIKQLPDDAFLDYSRRYLPEQSLSDRQLLAYGKLFKDRLNYFAELPELVKFLLVDRLDYDASLLIPKGGSREGALKSLKIARDYFNKASWATLSALELKTSLDQVIKDNDETRASLLWPTRVALTGLSQSPDVFDVALALGPNKVLGRLDQALFKPQA